jgi:hypothetical protein
MKVKIKKDKTFLLLSAILGILVIITAACGLFIPATYRLETTNWKVQGIAQDIVDLYLMVPLLFVTGFFVNNRNKFFLYAWAGTVLFIAYTYAIYCFAIHFNFLFPLYCFTFGVAIYSFIYFISLHISGEARQWYDDKVPARLTGIFLLLVAVSFYFLWFSEILPAIMQHTLPPSLVETGLLINPVHVIDISLFLPGMIIIAVFLFRQKPIAYLLAPVLLVFCILMYTSIGILVIIMKLKGTGDGFAVAVAMGLLALLGSILLFNFLSHLVKNR